MRVAVELLYGPRAWASQLPARSAAAARFMSTSSGFSYLSQQSGGSSSTAAAAAPQSTTAAISTAAASQQPVAVSAATAAAFRLLDGDSDGALSAAELQRSMQVRLLISLSAVRFLLTFMCPCVCLSMCAWQVLGCAVPPDMLREMLLHAAGAAAAAAAASAGRTTPAAISGGGGVGGVGAEGGMTTASMTLSDFARVWTSPPTL